MAKETTKSLFDVLKSGTPHHLLSPEEKRKRDTEKFFDDMAYFAFIESIHVYENLVRMRKQIENNIQTSYEQSLKNSREKELNLVLLMEAKRQQIEGRNFDKELQEKLNDRLNNIKSNLENTLTTLDSALKQLDELSKEQTKVVEKAYAEVITSRRKLAKSVKEHFIKQANDDEFKPHRLEVSLPEEWKKVEGAEKFKGHVEIDKSAYQEFGTDIAKILETGESSAEEVQHVVKDTVENKVHKILDSLLKHDLLSHISQFHKDRYIEEKKSEFAQPIINDIWKQLLRNKGVVEDFQGAFQAVKKHTKESLKSEILREARDEIADKKNFVEKNIDSILQLQRELNLSPNQSSAKNIDILPLQEFAETSAKEASTIMATVELDLQNVDSIALNADNFLEQIQAATSIEMLEDIHNKADIDMSVPSLQNESQAALTVEPVTKSEQDEKVAENNSTIKPT